MKDDKMLKEQFCTLARYAAPRPGLPGRVMETLQRNAGKQAASRGNSSRRRSLLPVPRLAMGAGAAALLILATALWLQPDGGPAIAFADVQAALQQIDTAVIECRCHKRRFWDHKIYYRRGSPMTVHVWENGVVHVNEQGGRTLLLNTQKKLARYSGGAPSQGSSEENLDRLANIEEYATGRLGERTIDGQKLVGFVLKPREMLEIQGLARTEVWVDPATRLPVREEFLPIDPEDIVTGMWSFTCFYRFNVPVDESLFQMTPPEGYTMLEGAGLHDLLARPHADVPNDPALATPTAELLGGIGPAKFGMKLREVLEVLGAPDGMGYSLQFRPEDLEQMDREFDEIYREVARRVEEQKLDPLEEEMLRARLLTDLRSKYLPSDVGRTVSLDYAARGLTLICDTDDGLVRVFCNSDESSLYGGYRGATKKGIAIGALVEDVEKAYGRPDITRMDEDGSGGLIYVSRAAQFHIVAGQVESFDFDVSPETSGYDNLEVDGE